MHYKTNWFSLVVGFNKILVFSCWVQGKGRILECCIEVFMDDFTVYGFSFLTCLDSVDRFLSRCIETNLVLNFDSQTQF